MQQYVPNSAQSDSCAAVSRVSAGFWGRVPQGFCHLCPLGIGEAPLGTAGCPCPRALAKVAGVGRRSWPVVDFGDSIIPWFKMDSVRVR